MERPPPDPIRQPHDALFRAVFSDPERAGDLLRSVLPSDLVSALDWSTLRRIDASFVDDELRQQHADLLFAVVAGGREVLVYLLLEHKSGDDPWLAFQLLRYVVRIWEQHRRERPGDRVLPAIVPYVLHHGATPWRGPCDLRGLIELAGLPQSLVDLQPQLAFVLDDLAAGDAAELERRQLAVETLLPLLHLQQVRRQRRVANLMRAWRALYERAYVGRGGHELFARLISYVLAVADDQIDDLRRAFASARPPTEHQFMSTAERLILQGLIRGRDQGRREGLQKGREEGRQEGRQEGREEGLRQGRAEALLSLLELRFGAPPAEVVAHVRAADAASLDRWIARILGAPGIDDVFDG